MEEITENLTKALNIQSELIKELQATVEVLTTKIDNISSEVEIIRNTY